MVFIFKGGKQYDVYSYDYFWCIGDLLCVLVLDCINLEVEPKIFQNWHLACYTDWHSLSVQNNVKILTCSSESFFNKIMNVPVAFCSCCFLSNNYNKFHDTFNVQETNFNDIHFHIQVTKQYFKGKFMVINVM